MEKRGRNSRRQREKKKKMNDNRIRWREMMGQSGEGEEKD